MYIHKNDSITFYILVIRSYLSDFQEKASMWKESSGLRSIKIGEQEVVSEEYNGVCVEEWT
jgi:hypothetical protein